MSQTNNSTRDQRALSNTPGPPLNQRPQRVRRPSFVTTCDANGNIIEVPTNISRRVLRDTVRWVQPIDRIVNMSRPLSPPPPPPITDPGEGREASPLPEVGGDPRQSRPLEETSHLASQNLHTETLRSQSSVRGVEANSVGAPHPVRSELAEPPAIPPRNNIGELLDAHSTHAFFSSDATTTQVPAIPTESPVPLEIRGVRNCNGPASGSTVSTALPQNILPPSWSNTQQQGGCPQQQQGGSQPNQQGDITHHQQGLPSNTLTLNTESVHATGQPESTANSPELGALFQIQLNTRRILFRIRELCLGPQGEELLSTHLCEILASALAREPEATELFDVDNSTFRSTVSSFLTRNRFRFPSIESTNFHSVITSSVTLPFDNPQPIVMSSQENDQTVFLAEDPFAPRPQIREDDPSAMHPPVRDEGLIARMQTYALQEVHPEPLVEAAAQALAEVCRDPLLRLQNVFPGTVTRPYYQSTAQTSILYGYMSITHGLHLRGERARGFDDHDAVRRWERVVYANAEDTARRSHRGRVQPEAIRNSDFYCPLLARARNLLRDPHMDINVFNAVHISGHDQRHTPRQANPTLNHRTGRQPQRAQNNRTSAHSRTYSAPHRGHNAGNITDVDELVLIPGSYEDYALARPISIPRGTTDIPEEFREDRCVICQDNLGSGQPVVTTQCQPLAHRFHTSCLTQWSQNQRGSRHVTCPSCRRPLQFTLPPPPPPQRRTLSLPRAGTREEILPALSQQPPPQQNVVSLPRTTSTTVVGPQTFSQVAESVAGVLHQNDSGGVTTFSQVARSAQIPVCTCGRRPGVQGRHSRHCEISRASAALGVPSPPLRTTQQEQLEVPPPGTIQHQQLDPTQNPLAERPAFGYGDVNTLAAQLPTLREIPFSARSAVATAFATTLRTANATTGTRRANAALHVYAFHLLLLHRPPPATHRSNTIATIVRERARLWMTPGGPSRLWQSALDTVRSRVDALGTRETAGETGVPTIENPTAADNNNNNEDSEVLETTAAARNVSHFGPLAHLLAGESEFPLTNAALARGDRAAAEGMYSRTCAALSAMPLAPTNLANAERLQNLHPGGGLPPPEFIRDFRDTAPFSEAEVRRWVSRFPRGTSWGPSGLRIELLGVLVRHPGANVALELGTFLHLMVTGQLDAAAIEAFYSARLLAAIKNLSGENLRPLACGEGLRRLSGKMTLARVSTSAATFFCSRRQLAVGVPGGLEAIIHAVQKLVRAYIADPATHSRKVFVKGDFRNAFNICSRMKMLLAARTHLPSAEPYLVSAYSQRTNLYFGERVISSETGTQQGDPLGTLGFALVLAEATERIDAAIRDSLDLEAWFADDSNVGADIDHAIAYFDALDALGEEFGLESNREKFEVYCHATLHAEAAQRFRTIKVFPLEQAHTLGGPVGSQTEVNNFAGELVRAATTTFARIASMSHMHRASSVLALCGRGIATHLCRCALPESAILSTLDSRLLEAASSIYGIPIDLRVATELSESYTRGGFGYRSIAPYAQIAYLAAELETRALQTRLLKPEFMEDTVARLLADEAFTVLNDAVVAAVRVAMITPNPGRQLQKKWSKILDQGRQWPEDTREKARRMSCAGSHLTLHPVIVQGESFEWLDNSRCSAIVRMRLGLPVYPTEQVCPFCRSSISDVHGVHVLSCLHGGHHTRAHNGGRDDIACLANRGLSSATTEAHCFPDAPTRRIDVFMRALTYGGRPTAADYALVSHAAYNVAAAADSTGGAATAYEEVKRREYGALAERAGVYLAPMIQDVYGAWGTTARSVLALLAQRMGDRSGHHRGTVTIMNHRWLLSRLQRRVADILLLATPPDATA